MDLIVVTGMSGAGKSQAINVLEDLGYFCVDNVPPRLLGKFMELLADSGGKIQRIALVVDVRSKDMFADYIACMDALRLGEYNFFTLFLDCDDDSLRRRYKETRRRHPLLSDRIPTVELAVQTERKMLAEAKNRADIVIDTTLISPMQLRARIRDLFAEGIGQSMTVHCMSFGFKKGAPQDADLLFDVRCLPNPFYLEELREKTGLDLPVRRYVLENEQAQGLIPKLFSLIDYLLPLYCQEGKSQLVVCIGCTGGRHRSVVFAELLAAHLAENGVPVNVTHRDIGN